MNNKSNFWKQVAYVMKTIMEHINHSYDSANKSVQIGNEVYSQSTSDWKKTTVERFK